MMDENIVKDYPLKLVGSFFFINKILLTGTFSVNHVLLTGTHPQHINQRKKIEMSLCTYLTGLPLNTICD